MGENVKRRGTTGRSIFFCGRFFVFRALMRLPRHHDLSHFLKHIQGIGLLQDKEHIHVVLPLRLLRRMEKIKRGTLNGNFPHPPMNSYPANPALVLVGTGRQILLPVRFFQRRVPYIQLYHKTSQISIKCFLVHHFMERFRGVKRFSGLGCEFNR